MRKKALKYVFSVLLIIIIISSLFIYLHIKNVNKISEETLLNLANTIISEEVVNNDLSNNNEKYVNTQELLLKQELSSVDKISSNNNVIGKIKIPQINLEAPIQDGTNSEILKRSVGHFTSTKYWGGNVGLAAHNRGTYAHYFENLNKLNLGDEIIYQTKLGTRIYVVSKIEQISEDNLSILKDTKDNTLTLVTCITNNPTYRLCVKASEKKC